MMSTRYSAGLYMIDMVMNPRSGMPHRSIDVAMTPTPASAAVPHTAGRAPPR